MTDAVLFDIDGTLLDSNDAHAHAWLEALQEAGIHREFGEVRRRIGMGGDHLLPSLLGVTDDSELGKKLSRRRGEIFRAKYLPHLKPFPGARALVEELKRRGLRVVAATSSSKDDVHGLLEKADVADLLKEFTSADDAESSKPDPDILCSALKKSGAPAARAVMIGDTPYDVEAARRAGVRILAFTCGGWDAASLEGAHRVFEGPWDLLKDLDSVELFSANYV